jgi:endonuclease/exonuclease/phosphatase family metal-dependent hydrolase
MNRFVRSGVISALLASLVAVSSAAAEPTRIGSWNLMRLGHGKDRDIDGMARVASLFDIMALQEVMTTEGANDLLGRIEAVSGEDWDMILSDEIGRGSYKEMYALIWKTQKVSWIDGAVVYTDADDIFAREPLSARFQDRDGFAFVLASAHIIYGDSVTEREVEVRALGEYRDWLTASFPETPVFISGDFNLPPDNDAWNAMGAASYPMITSGATTLSSKDKTYANLYDNIWAPSGIALPIVSAGIVQYPDTILNIDHETARRRVSDHAPVWLEINSDADDMVLPPFFSGVVQKQKPAEASPDAVLTDIIGNNNSLIYHLANCPGYKATSAKNRVPFATEAAALAAGFRKAKNCS